MFLAVRTGEIYLRHTPREPSGGILLLACTVVSFISRNNYRGHKTQSAILANTA